MRRVYSITAMLLLLITAFAAAQNPKKQKAVVSGQVRAASTDAKGNVLTIEIMVGDEGTDQEPYQVIFTPPKNPNKPKPSFDELKKLVGEWIVASGEVSEDQLGWKTIDISKLLPSDFAKPQQ